MRYLLFVSAALAFACGDTPITPSDPLEPLVGSWTLQSWELREVGNPTNKLDMVADGFTGSLQVAQTGTFTFSLSYLGDTASSLTGTLAFRGDTLVFHSEDGESLLRYSASGATMTWETIETSLIDVDADDEPESVIEYIVFRRQ